MTDHLNSPPSNNHRGWLTASRVLIVGLVGVIVVLGLILIVMAIADDQARDLDVRTDALAGSKNECVTCHRRTTPGIVEQYGVSTMAAAEVTCENCHEVKADYPGAVEHEGTYVLNSPTTAMCETCHTAEVRQYYASRHSIPAYAAMVGLEGLTEAELAAYNAIPEAAIKPNEQRNALYHLEGPEITRFACEDCHNIGAPAPDGSIGQCQKCHLRHEFSVEQVRKPQTCNACHIGPDHPQWEIYQESPHGIAFATMGHTWNWTAEAGTLTVEDFPAATCAICHMSGFGSTGTTHDLGDRLTWYLFQPISVRRPAWEDNKVRMQGVCLECHNTNFITDFYNDADVLVGAINSWVEESDRIVQVLKDNDLVTAEPFDEPIDFIYFELWHHWGRTAKFGAWMQGPDYTQWHGAYEMLSDLADLREIAVDLLEGAGLEVPDSLLTKGQPLAPAAVEAPESAEEAGAAAGETTEEPEATQEAAGS
ncbi:MAG: nitrate reductase [Anaerolineae bacterium]|nr:nitrate reductase [Anaerolineae bacterium]